MFKCCTIFSTSHTNRVGHTPGKSAPIFVVIVVTAATVVVVVVVVVQWPYFISAARREACAKGA